MEENTILRDGRVLEEEFMPARMLHRDGQLKALRDCLQPVIDGKQAHHSFVYGPPGTGKTTSTRYVAEELRNAAPVAVSYVNCWEDSTRFKVLFTILKGMGAFLHRKGTPTDELVDIFRGRVSGKGCIVILDEIDQLAEDRVLYDLLQAGAGLVMISNSESALYQADPRVRSRLSSAESIPYYRYSVREVTEILHDRAEWGLIPGVVSRQQLETIATLSCGDARTALGILSLASRKAEQAGLKKIPDSLIAPPQVSAAKNVENLTPTQKVVMDALRTGTKTSGELFAIAGKAAPLQARTFRKQMEKLVRLGLISSSGESRWRAYSLVE